MKISRYSNNQSDIVDELVKNIPDKNSGQSFDQVISDILSQPKQKTLRDIFAQFEELEEAGPNLGPDSDVTSYQDHPGDLDGPNLEPDDLLDETGDGEGEGEAGQDVKQKLVEALIAACGSLEAAKSCLEEHSMDSMSDMGTMPEPDMGMSEPGMDMPEPEITPDMGMPESEPSPLPMM